MKAKSAAQILKKINCQYLNLYKGEGYWYFIYDSGDVYESESVMVMRLNDMELDSWVYDGKAFVESCEKKAAELASYENMSMIYVNMKKGD